MLFASKKASELIKSIPYTIDIVEGRQKGFSIFLHPYTDKRWMMVDKAEDHLFVVIDVAKNDLNIEQLSELLHIPISKRGKTSMKMMTAYV